MKGAIIVIISLLIIGFGLFRWFQPSSAGVPNLVLSETPQAVSVSLHSERRSGITGTLLLATEGEETLATMSLSTLTAASSTPITAAYRATIYRGSCAFFGKVAYVLSEVKNNQAVTTLPIGLSALTEEGPMAIALETVDESEVNLVACGEIEF